MAVIYLNGKTGRTQCDVALQIGMERRADVTTRVEAERNRNTQRSDVTMGKQISSSICSKGQTHPGQRERTGHLGADSRHHSGGLPPTIITGSAEW